jgi:hypothetical protein
MRKEKFKCFSLIMMVAFGTQSLLDVAQQEAERRRQLENQGVKEKVIEGSGKSLAPNGNLTVSTLPGPRSQKLDVPGKDQKNKASIQSYRAALQKLDRAIRENEMRMDALRARRQSEKARISQSSRAPDTQSKLQEQINALQIKIEQARKDRTGIYRSGRKDGYLPGELEGKGIIP